MFKLKRNAKLLNELNLLDSLLQVLEYLLIFEDLDVDRVVLL